MKLLLCAALGSLALLLPSAAAAGRLAEREPPQVASVVNDLADGASDAKVAALNAKAAAAAVRARAAAAEAATAETRAEELQVKNEAKKPILTKDLKVATDEADLAEAAAQRAVASLEQTKVIASTAVDEAKVMAVEEVKKRLTAMYKKLDEWRNKVLRSPYDEARIAGLKAAEPYNNMIRTLQNKIHEFQMVASGYMGNANSLEGAAEGLAGGAQGRMNGGDPVGANQDLMSAQAMQGRAKTEAAAAAGLQGQANGMNKLISEYIAAGHMAAWAAEYKADPDALPPPPTDPNHAFTPPPPAMLQLGKAGFKSSATSGAAAKEEAEEKREYQESWASFRKEKQEVEAGEPSLERELHDFKPALAVESSFEKAGLVQISPVSQLKPAPALRASTSRRST